MAQTDLFTLPHKPWNAGRLVGANGPRPRFAVLVSAWVVDWMTGVGQAERAWRIFNDRLDLVSDQVPLGFFASSATRLTSTRPSFAAASIQASPSLSIHPL